MNKIILLKKYISEKNMKKLISIILSVFIINSFIVQNLSYAASFAILNNAPASVNINPMTGAISDIFIGSSQNTVVFIQDLHGNHSVQKNISKMIEFFDKKYGINKILMEGVPEWKTDTSAIDNLRPYKISDLLLNKGLLTGTEYYILNNVSNIKVSGLENWNIYLSNIKRAAEILRDKPYITSTYNDLKQTLHKKIKNSKNLLKYVNFDLSNAKLLKAVNRPILKYNDLHKYIYLNDNINKINLTTLNREYSSFIKELQARLEFKKYQNLINLSKKENLTEYYLSLYNEFINEKEYFSKYGNLYSFLKYNSEKSKLNTISLISQQNKYFNDFLTSISFNDYATDIFVLKMTELFESFLQLSISEEEYDFFADNYERYVNLLPLYLAQEYDKYQDLLFYDIIFDYHQVNKSRNEIFLKNISQALKNRNNGSKVTVVVAGGFHSSLLNKLKQNNISYLLITPFIESGTDTILYDEILLSTVADFDKNALAPIPFMLANTGEIPQETIKVFFENMIEALISAKDRSPEEIKKIISSIAANKLVFNIPISVKIEGSKFFINVKEEVLEFDIEDNKISWKNHEQDIFDYQHNTDKESKDLTSKITAFIKNKFNIMQATSMRLNPASSYSSKFISKRTGKRKNFMFSLSMILSTLKLYNLSYDLMMGFASLKKNHAVTYTIDFDNDFDEQTKQSKEFAAFKEKKLDVIIEKGLEKYITKEDIAAILLKSIRRIDEPVTKFKDSIFIGLLSKSTNLFEDHLNNGFIGVNEGILQIQDETVKKALIETGIIHEIAHELKGELNSSNYKIFEDRMMFSDIKFVIEYIAKEEYGEDFDLQQILYTDKYEIIVKRITGALLAPAYEPETKKYVSLFTEDIRFMRKFKNYKYNIDDIAAFIKRKDFSIDGRRGQLKHIETEYLKDNLAAQEKLFSNLIKEPDEEMSMQDFLERHIPKSRIDEVNEKINELIQNLESMLNSSDLKETNPKLVEKIIKDFKTSIYGCLELMYKKMPQYIFGRFYNEQAVIADHSLNHSIEVLNSAIKILGREISSIKNKKLDTKTLVYSAFLHDISCSLLRLNHEQNSATWAKSILTGTLSEEEVTKIYNVCLGHKKAKNGIPRQEHNDYYEAKILHDADGIAAALDLQRILGVWLSHKEPFVNKNTTLEERIKLIETNKYLAGDGGDAVNDLMRQFLRRNPDLYLTSGAKEIILASKSNPYTVRDFINSNAVRNELKNAGMNITDEDIDHAIEIVDTTLSKLIPEYKDYDIDTDTAAVNEESSFGSKEKFSLLQKILLYIFKKKTVFRQNIALSDIHGGYARFSELLVNLIDPTYDMSDKSDEDVENEIMERLQYTGNNNIFYLLGDMLDRGSRQVESFQLIKRMSDAGKIKYVIGNHDLYAFMNLLGLHLPSYPDFKGIKEDYVDFRGRKVKEFLEEKKKNNKILKEKSFWSARLIEYMKYAEHEQSKWTQREAELQNLFANTFGFILDKEGNDILNNAPKKGNERNSKEEIFTDNVMLNFHKKFFGRNVGIVVYTGIRAVNKMSVNWWIDRQEELKYLKATYPQYGSYWKQMEDIVNDILMQQKEKMEFEEQKGNWEWGVIDAIMYRNYESTEWNALDWAYHKNWGGGEKGFIAQRNMQLRHEGKTELNYVSYFDDSLINDLLNFYKDNFYLYRIDEYGICYMHSLLPVDSEGDVSLGYVDEDGVFHERDKKGKRIKGFYYKGKQYKGKNIFKGLTLIAQDIRNYDISSNNLSSISEALTLLTAIYADNTTRIKPANLKEMKKKFGFNRILSKKGITTMVVGHNPINKLDSQFEYVTLRFFNKEFKIINLIHIDGNMSPEYAPPKGAGIARLIGGGVNTRGFISGESTEITSSSTPDVSLDVFIASAFMNLFPFARKVLLFTEQIYRKYDSIKQFLSPNFAKKNNTTLIGIINDMEELNKLEDAHSKGIKTLAIIKNSLIHNISSDKSLLEQAKINIENTEIHFNINLNKIKVANGYIYAISADYDKVTDIAEDVIQKAINTYILEQIKNNKYKKHLQTEKNIILNSSLDESFEQIQKPISKHFASLIEDSFGIIPVLYDIRILKSSGVVPDLTKNIALDKVKTMLAAA